MSDPTRKRTRLHPGQTLTIEARRRPWTWPSDVQRLLDQLNPLIEGTIRIEEPKCPSTR